LTGLNPGAEIPMKKPKQKFRLGPLILVLILSIVVGTIGIRVNWQIHMRELRNHIGYQLTRLAQARG